MAINQLRSEIDDFLYRDVEVVEGYSHNQYDIIKRVHLYMNDQFESGGEDRIFHNIVKYRREAIARFLDIDTKDIRLLPTNPKSVYGTMFLEAELKHWLKKNKFGMLLNEMATELATYGSCVIRKTKEGADIVDLRNLFLDPAVKDINDSRFITIKHYLTPSELKAKTKDGWDEEAINRIIEAVKDNESNSRESYEDDHINEGTTSAPLIEVYERFGELQQDECDDIGLDVKEEFARTHIIIAEPHRTQLTVDAQGNEYLEELAEVLYKKEWKGEYPFRDVHYAKTQGRWLGIGVVEDLFNAQERVNEIENQKRKSMELSSMHLFQTADKTILENVLTDLMNGDIIFSKQGINPIANEERNLPAFNDEYDTWNVLADRVSFANDLITGNAIPASTPATNAVIQNTNATSVFLFKRQNFSLFLQEFFNELVLPQVLKDLSPEHMIRYVGEPAQLDILDQSLVNDSIVMEILKSGRPLMQEEIQAIEFKTKEKLGRNGNTRFVDIKEKMYDDLEFEFDIIITNEQENTQVIQQNTFSLLTTLGQNPGLQDDPVFKTLLFDYAEKSGINPAKLELAAGQRKSQLGGQQSMGQSIEGLMNKVQDVTGVEANLNQNGQTEETTTG